MCPTTTGELRRQTPRLPLQRDLSDPEGVAALLEGPDGEVLQARRPIRGASESAGGHDGGLQIQPANLRGRDLGRRRLAAVTAHRAGARPRRPDGSGQGVNRHLLRHDVEKVRRAFGLLGERGDASAQGQRRQLDPEESRGRGVGRLRLDQRHLVQDVPPARVHHCASLCHHHPSPGSALPTSGGVRPRGVHPGTDLFALDADEGRRKLPPGHRERPERPLQSLPGLPPAGERRGRQEWRRDLRVADQGMPDGHPLPESGKGLASVETGAVQSSLGPSKQSHAVSLREEPAGVRLAADRAHQEHQVPGLPGQHGQDQAVQDGLPQPHLPGAGGHGALQRVPRVPHHSPISERVAKRPFVSRFQQDLLGRVDGVRSGNEEKHVHSDQQLAAQLVQDLGHQGHRHAHAGVLVDAHPSAGPVQLLHRHQLHVGLRHRLALHQSLQVRRLHGGTGSPRHRHVVFKVPALLPPKLRPVHHFRTQQQRAYELRGRRVPEASADGVGWSQQGGRSGGVQGGRQIAHRRWRRHGVLQRQ